MSNSGTVIHYIGCHQSPNPLPPRKYTVFNENVMVDLCDVFQEHNPGIKQDLPVIQNTIQQDSNSLQSHDTAFPDSLV